MRLTRSGMVDALAYIRTARAKGAVAHGDRAEKHALRNAAMPVVAISAVQLGFMLSGSIVIETVFWLNGVGYLGWEAISKNDFPVVQSVVLFLGHRLCGADASGRPDERRPRPAAAHAVKAPLP